MDNIIIIAVILAILAIAGWYIYKAKKSGKKCIGCPDSCCGCGSEKGCQGSCSCGSKTK